MTARPQLDDQDIDDTCADCPSADCYGCTALVHEHEWLDWFSLAWSRDSFGRVIVSSGVSLRRLTGTGKPQTEGWWRACRTCPAEERTHP